MTKFLLSVLLISLSTALFSQQSKLDNSQNEFRIISSTSSELVIENVFQQFSFEDIKLNNETFIKIVSDEYSTSNEISAPELPVFKKLIEIPFGATVKVEVIESEITEFTLKDFGKTGRIVPKLSSVRKDMQRQFELNDAIYSENKYYSCNSAEVKVLGIMRDRCLARLEISPISYNPVTARLRIIKRMQIKILFNKYDTVENQRIKAIYNSPFFNSVQDGIISPPSMNLIKTGTQSIAAKYVIVSDTMFRKTLQPFIKWKQKKGFQVVEVYTNSPQVGKTATQIKAYLKNMYDNASLNNPAPSFILLVGDTTQLTVFKGVSETNHYTDLYFCEYTGDAFPEVLYGRFSASDTNQLKNQIEKTIEYEKYLMANPAFLAKSVLIAGVDNSYSVTHANPQISYANSNYFNSSNGITPSVYLYPNSMNAASNIIQDVNNGASIVNYTAHGSYLGWSNPAFSVSSVSALTNTGKYPLMIGNACETGRFEQAVCFGESLVRAEKKGALAYIGASNNTYWDEDYYWSVGFKNVTSNPAYNASHLGAYDKMFHTHAENFSNWAMTNSQIVKAGNLAVTQSGDYILYYWEIYHLFGDPSLMVYQYVPSPQSPTFNSVIPLGLGSFNVVATPYSMVSISKNDSLISSAFADSLGFASLTFDPQTPAGVYDLTITAQNKIPFFTSLTIVNPNGPFLTVNDVEVNDFQGNKNKQAENNETFSLKFDLKNLTNYSCNALQLKIKSADTNLIIVDSIRQISQVAGLTTNTLDSVFILKIKPGVKNNTQIFVEVRISDSNGNNWISYSYIRVYSPELEVVQYEFSDQNSNGHIDIGETVFMNYSIKNSGENDLANVQTELSANVNNLTISAGNLIDTIHKGETKQVQFSVLIPSTIWNGTAIGFVFKASNQEYSTEHSTAKMVGEVDEDFETGNFTKFGWTLSSSSNWITTQNNVAEGLYCARSPLVLANSSSSALQLELNVLADDSIHFYRKVSSEENYDILKFNIDNIKIAEWSGNENWAKVSYPVKAGNHLFSWVYSKDGFGAEGDDAAYIDLITFPVNDAFTSISGIEKGKARASVYPNPAAKIITLSLYQFDSKDVNIQIYDLNGKLILELKHSLPSQSCELPIDINGINSGFYTLKIIGEREVRSIKLSILE